LIQILQHAPPWVWTNYAKKFPEVFSAINVKFFGFSIDQEIHRDLKKEADKDLARAKASLLTMADEPSFNPGSWQQVSRLLYDILGAKKPARRGKKSTAGTDETTLKKIALQHPLIERFVDNILKYRGEAKAIGTYYNAHQYHGRLKFAQNIDGTTTGRHSSNKLPMYIPNATGKKKDEANYGTQIQNIPIYMRKCLQADKGYRLGEVDKKQSEARYTAYMSQDLELIRALESGEDFYIYSTKRFFGIELDPNDPTLHNKGSFRQITKKIIHGTNYMMGAETFIDAFIQEIGFAEFRAAQTLLGMEKVPLKEFAKYLLGLYHKAYPEVPKWWEDTHKILIKTNRIVTPDGWTRLFFGDVRKDHKRLRDAVAHQPQHTSVAGINKSMLSLLRLQLDSGGDYIMMAQIHDSIIFQAKEEVFDEYMIATREAMTTVEAIHGRSVNIPLETNHGHYWNPMEEWKEAV
jgi:DNA polymerase I-like protein with 3'-5' exonuclease and polymerase domains